MLNVLQLLVGYVQLLIAEKMYKGTLNIIKEHCPVVCLNILQSVNQFSLSRSTAGYRLPPSCATKPSPPPFTSSSRQCCY